VVVPDGAAEARGDVALDEGADNMATTAGVLCVNDESEEDNAATTGAGGAALTLTSNDRFGAAARGLVALDAGADVAGEATPVASNTSGGGAITAAASCPESRGLTILDAGAAGGADATAATEVFPETSDSADVGCDAVTDESV
jgi:hypothetical protein